MLGLLQWAVVGLAALGVLCLVYRAALGGEGRGEGGDEFSHLF
jgi:hypothetical protein